MGVTATLAAVAVGGAVVGSQMSKPPSMPNPLIGAPKTDEGALANAGANAADQRRKRAAAASEQGSTILTGPQGLGDVPDQNKGAKSLLGY